MAGTGLVGGRKLWACRVLRGALFAAPLLAGFAFLSTVSRAQQAPTADQLQQLQQQMGQRLGPAVPQLETPQPNLVMQPDIMLPQMSRQPSRLEQIMSARAGVTLQQFGYDQLGSGRPVTLPQTGAVQDDYVLGTGDEIVMTLRGQEDRDVRAVIDRNGQVVLPRLNPIPALGRTFGSFRADVEAAVRSSYVASTAFVSVGRVRQISVLVSGEVNNPGQRLLTGLSSVVDALLLSGGVRKTGSLRNVRIQRGGRQITVDLYSVLTAGGSASAMRLADGDRIIVPLLGPTVAVSGLVRQPGIFELPPRQTSISVASLLQLVGGQEVRGLYRFNLLRIEADGRTNFVTVNEQNGVVRDSEILFVQLGADQVVNQATLSGSTGLAGGYTVSDGMRLSQLLRLPGAMGDSPYSLFGLVVRRDTRSLLRTLLPVTPVAIVNGRDDLILQSDDKVRIFTTAEVRLLDYVVRAYLQRLARADNEMRTPLESSRGNSNALAGGFAGLQQAAEEEYQLVASAQSYIFNVPSEIQRGAIIALMEEPAPGSYQALARAEAMRRNAEVLATGRSSSAVPMVTTSGQPTAPLPGQPGTLLPGQQPLPQVPGQPIAGVTGTPNQQFSPMPSQQPFPSTSVDPSNPAGWAWSFQENRPDSTQFRSAQEIQTFGQLVRELGVDPLVLINFLVEKRARLDGAVRGPGDYLIGPSTTLNDLVVVAGGTVSWANQNSVELISNVVDREGGKGSTVMRTLTLNNNDLASYVVQPGDQLRFPQIAVGTVGSITIQGEVRNPGTFAVKRGDRISDVLARAGGLTEVAYPMGTVFLRQSVAQQERESYQRAAREVQEQLVVATTRIGTSRIDPGSFASMQTFVNELRQQRALGRISVTADPAVLASRPELDVLLETGDVIYIPQRPSTISVLGQVMQPGTYPVSNSADVADYIARAGGRARTADTSETYVVLPDGSARKVQTSWFRYDSTALPPGSTIVVPRDIAPFDLRQTVIDVTQIFSQLAVSIASVAVISNQ